MAYNPELIHLQPPALATPSKPCLHARCPRRGPTVLAAVLLLCACRASSGLAEVSAAPPAQPVGVETATTPAPAEQPRVVPAPALEPPPTPMPTPAPTRLPLRAATPTEMPTPALAPGPPPIAGLADQIGRLLREGVERGDFSGATAVVQVEGRTVARSAIGLAFSHRAPGEPDEAPIPMRPETLFDIASVTKLFTATAVAQLVERGLVELDAPAARWLPRAMGGAKATITVRQLLTHTSGLPAGPGYARMALGEPDAILRDVPLERRPGSGYLYSDLGFLALGRLVEVVARLRLDRYVDERILRPLGLERTGYRPAVDRREIAASEVFTEPSVGRTGLVWGTVHDPLAHSVGGVAGHAGLFSTADDLAAFGQMMLDGGQGRAGRALEQATVEAMVSAQYRRGSTMVGLGWELDQAWYMGGLSGRGAFGHTGFTGASLVVSPERRAVVVVLANRLHPTPRGDGLRRYRQGVADVVARLTPPSGN